VVNARGGKASLKVRVDDIAQEVSDNTGNISSIRQTAEGVETEVVNARGGKASLKVRVDDIAQEVSDNTGNISTIKQKVDNLTLFVTNGDTSSTISLKSGDITLSSKEIKMTGVVTFTDLSTSGSTTINGGNITTGTISGSRIDGKTLVITKGATIAGWNLDDNSIYKHSGSWSEGTFMCTGSKNSYSIGGSETISDWVFGAGGRFGVTSSGEVWCSNIHATGGIIGGWHISNHGLSNGEWRSESDTSQESYDFILIGSTGLSHPQWGHDGFFNPGVDWDSIIDCVAEWEETNSSESDANVKNSISVLDEAYDGMFDNLMPCKYKYNHGTSDRYHTGFIAQEVVSAIKYAGLTTQDFAGVVHLDKPNENGCEWLLRRDEFVALNTWQIQKLKQRVAALECEIAELRR
jgi:hypothetical protein